MVFVGMRWCPLPLAASFAKLIGLYNTCRMQIKQLDHRSVEIPATFVASMAKFLRRCEAHEAERSQGRTSFPRVVTVALSEHARMWASYLDSLLEGFPDRRALSTSNPGIEIAVFDLTTMARPRVERRESRQANT